MFSYILYRIGQILALSCPLRIAYAIAVFLADLRYLSAAADRKNVAANLRVIFPDKAESEIERISREVFRNFAKYLVDFFRLDGIDLDYINKNISIHNINYLEDTLKEGRGSILVTAHLGNWELGGVIVRALGHPFVTVALKHKSDEVNDFFTRQRERKGLKVIPLGSAAKACLKVLRNNELLALVGDRNFIGKGITLDFFGRPTVFPLGPAYLSLQTRATIVPGFLLRKPDDKFDLVFVEPIKHTPCGDRDKDLKQIADKYKSVIEEYVRRYPQQWFMFRQFWSA